MTLSSDSSMVVKMGHSEEETSAMHVESREARKHLRKLGRVIKVVATHRLKELRHLQAVEKLATGRRTYGFDRLANGDDSWVDRNLPPTPEQITASLWTDLKELKYAISMSGKDGSRQKVGSFINEIEQGTVSDEEFARIKRLMERRGRDAAHVTIAPVDTAQYCSPRSPSSETSFDTHGIWRKRTRVGWTWSKTSSNHHRPVRVLKHPDSSVTQTGRLDKLPPPVLARGRGFEFCGKGETLFPSPKSQYRLQR